MNQSLYQTHHCPDQTHRTWNNETEPCMTIQSGDIVTFDFKDVSNLQLNLNSTVEDFIHADKSQFHPLNGPIYIEEAEAGDVLEVEILDLQTKGWGWTAIIPGKGLLPEEINGPYLRTFDLSNGKNFKFNEDITIPIKPFLGTMGVAPAEKGDFPIIPPGNHGGNIDVRHLTKGASIFLPVHVKGALFSAGDGHAAQGDGEVCNTGVEAPLYGELRFKVHKGQSIQAPRFKTAKNPFHLDDENTEYYGTTGVGPDLRCCAQDAIREMIDYLQTNHGLTKEDAYVLASLTVDLKISEIVNKPNYVVSAYLPLSIFNQ